MRLLPASAIILCLACGGGSREWRLPAEIEGGWKLSVLPPSRESSDMVNSLSPRRSQMAGYEGPGKMLVTAFELGSGPAAFEQVQKWRAQPGKIVFSHGSWFVVLESEGLDTSQLSKLAGLIEKSMPK
jgi:hypothetical protein